MKNKIWQNKIALALLTAGLLLSACQSGQPSRGVPYSRGPNKPPEQMKAPTTPPPKVSDANNEASLDAPKVVTTNENIRLTLPRKAE